MSVAIIDIGCSFVKSYLVKDDKVFSSFRLKTSHEDLFTDAMTCFDNVKSDESESAIVISTSDCVVWESIDGEVGVVRHEHPPYWCDGLTPYNKSGHPRYDKLRGAGNQMLDTLQKPGLSRVKRILPISAYVATLIADNPEWNGWDLTHATNSGLYDYDKGGWADEAQPFIDAGVIDAKIYPCDTLVEGNTFRRVYLGGHDSVFANAIEFPYSTKPYISCGTWTTVSVEYDMEKGIPGGRGKIRYIAAPNGAILQQLCFPSDPEELDLSVKKIIGFLNEAFYHIPADAEVKVFWFVVKRDV